MTPDELLQIARKRGIPEEQIQSAISGKQPAPTIGQRAGGAVQGGIRGLLAGIGVSPDTVLGGGANDYYAKALAQEQAKSMFDKPDYVVSYDKDGKPVFTQTPGNIKNAPFYSSPLGAAYYDAKTGQAKSQGEQAKTETEIMNDVKGKLGSGGGSDITPGTTVQAGPYNIPLNPKLTETEQGIVGGVQAMEPMIGRIQQHLDSGILDNGGFGDVSRTLNQLRTDQQSALLTATNPKLQAFQSDLNTLKKTIPFTEGGKQLTSTEKAMVMALLNISGKSNPQIMNDINQAMQILRAKEKLAIGGRNTAVEGTQQTQPSQYQIGQVINGPDNKQYRVIGLSNPNDPDLEPVQ